MRNDTELQRGEGGETADEGHWGFPLCRTRKDMRSR